MATLKLLFGVAIIGALFYFIIQDWFNTYIQQADPFNTTKAKTGRKG